MQLFKMMFPMKHSAYTDQMMSNLSESDRKKWATVQHHASILANSGVCVRFVPLYFDLKSGVWWADYMHAYVENCEPRREDECVGSGQYDYPYLFFEIKIGEDDKMMEMDATPPITGHHRMTDGTREAFSVFLQNTFPILQWNGDYEHLFEGDIGVFDREEWNKIKNEEQEIEYL